MPTEPAATLSPALLDGREGGGGGGSEGCPRGSSTWHGWGLVGTLSTGSVRHQPASSSGCCPSCVWGGGGGAYRPPGSSINALSACLQGLFSFIQAKVSECLLLLGPGFPSQDRRSGLGVDVN